MQPIMLIIKFIPGQGVQVQGPIQDKTLCYGLLESAKDAIRDFKPPTVEVPAPGVARSLLQGVNLGNGGS